MSVSIAHHNQNTKMIFYTFLVFFSSSYKINKSQKEIFIGKFGENQANDNIF